MSALALAAAAAVQLRARPAGRARRLALLPAGATAVLAIGLASRNGGYDGGDASAAGLAALALLALRLLFFGWSGESPAVRRILLAFGAFCAWSYASVLWAAVPDAAWQAANRSALYGLVLAVIASRRWRRREAAGLIALVVLGLAALAVSVLLRPADAAGMFVDGRLAAPAGYQNAAAELWLIGLWPALGLACVVPLGSAGRALWLALAALLAQTSLLSQSRGGLLAMAVIAVAFLLLGRPCGRAAAALATVAGACAITWGALAAVHGARGASQLAGAFSHARLAIALSCVGVGVFVLATDSLAAPATHLIAGLRRRLHRPIPGRRDVLAGAAVALLAVLVLTAHPAGWAQDRWHDFRSSGYARVDAGSTRFAGGLGSNRYDFYRVAVDEWLAHPLVGIGGDNFRLPYLAQRRSSEAPRYPHSLPLALLAELGLVGAALFAGFAVFVVRGLTDVVGRGPPTALGALLGFASLLVHASVDWLWEFPGLGVLAFVLLGIALRTERPGDRPPVPAPARARGRRLAATALAGVPLLASFAVVLAAQRAIASGQGAAAAHPVAAIADFERAAAIDRLQSDSLVSEAILAARIGRPAVAVRALDRAIARVPGDWFGHFELALVDASLGDRAGALAELARARPLNPRQPAIAAAAALVAANRPVSPATVDRALTAPLRGRLAPTGT